MPKAALRMLIASCANPVKLILPPDFDAALDYQDLVHPRAEYTRVGTNTQSNVRQYQQQHDTDEDTSDEETSDEDAGGVRNALRIQRTGSDFEDFELGGMNRHAYFMQSDLEAQGDLPPIPTDKPSAKSLEFLQSRKNIDSASAGAHPSVQFPAAGPRRSLSDIMLAEGMILPVRTALSCRFNLVLSLLVRRSLYVPLSLHVRLSSYVPLSLHVPLSLSRQELLLLALSFLSIYFFFTSFESCCGKWINCCSSYLKGFGRSRAKCQFF